MSNDDAEKVLDVKLVCEGRSSGKMRNDLKVFGSWNPDNPWELATDEGAFHGGDATAPPPLALFGAAVTACFMTQVRAFAKKLRVPVNSLRVQGVFRWQARSRGTDPYVSNPVGFGLDIEIDSPAPLDELRKLIGAAKKGCFLEQTLVQANAIDHRLKVDGEWLDI